jgi:hypothetical protein
MSHPLDAIAGLEFQTADRPRVRCVLAHIVDIDGRRIEIGRREATGAGGCLHVALFGELLACGLRAPRPILVAVDRCPSLSARVRAAFGSRAHILEDAVGREAARGNCRGDDSRPDMPWPPRKARTA